MARHPHFRWWAYSAAVAAVVAGTSVRMLLDPWLGDQLVLAANLVAGVAVAWFCGLRPAVLALVLGWWAAEFFFMPPRSTWSLHVPTVQHAAMVAVYFLIGGVGAYLCHRVRGVGSEPTPEQIKIAHLAAIVTSSDDAIISKNLSGVITSWNTAAERLFGYTAAEAVGRPVTMLIPEDRADEEPGILSRIGRGEVVSHYETVRRRKDGGLVNISLTVSPLRDSRGTVVGASKIVRDITASRAAQQALHASEAQARRALVEAESAIRTKDEFLAMLSHELRTPMAAILGWARMLRSGMSAEESRQGIEVIERNARLQSQIIEDLLDMSRIMSGKFRLDVQSVNVSQVLRAAVDGVRLAAEAKDVRLTMAGGAGVGEVRGDPNRLQQVFFNLLSNAAKFTPRGGSIRVECEQRGSYVEVVVSDSGMGIKPEFLAHVFDRFKQQDGKITRQHQGLGLGLAIVKHLVELHGGTVSVSSEGEGRGAAFTVRLPVSAALAARVSSGWGELGERGGAERWRAGVEAERPDPAALAGLTVMVTDDEPDARELIRRMLERRGARVLVCGSAEDALDRLQRHRPSVLVCDIGMPGVDGYDLIGRVRASAPDKGGATPAIALTAFARSEDRTRALLAGFQMHLAKPVEPEELVAGIRSVAAVG